MSAEIGGSDKAGACFLVSRRLQMPDGSVDGPFIKTFEGELGSNRRPRPAAAGPLISPQARARIIVKEATGLILRHRARRLLRRHTASAKVGNNLVAGTDAGAKVSWQSR